MFLALLLGSLVGLSLGLTGGGGSIFAVPLLVYGLGLEFREAVAISLLVVGSIAAFGAVVHGVRREVLWGAGLMLGVGGIITAPLGARLGAQLGETVALGLFAVVMFCVGYPMLRGGGIGDRLEWGELRCPLGLMGRPRFSLLCASKLLVGGFVVGVLSGLFGVGGGFLIVPALTMVLPIAFETALASSLVSVSLIAVAGVLAHAEDLRSAIDVTIGFFILGGVLGMVTGIILKRRLDREKLRRAFGGVTLGAAVLVLFLSGWL